MDFSRYNNNSVQTLRYSMAVSTAPNHNTLPYYPEFDLKPSSEPRRGPWIPKCLSKVVIMDYGTHRLRGILFLLAAFEYMEYHSRFYGIMSSIEPQLCDPKCEPWVLVNGMLGMTWVHGQHLPEGESDRVETSPPAASHNPALNMDAKPAAAKELPFIALTDNTEFFTSASDQLVIGYCNDFGSTFRPANMEYSNDLIVALPCRQSLATVRMRPTYQKGGYDSQAIYDYPPLPVDGSLLQLIQKIQTASADKATSKRGVVQKKWLKANTPMHFDNKGHLSNRSPLFAHRGNEAIFFRELWWGLCYPLNADEERVAEQGFALLPSAYHQVLFPDISGACLT